MGSGDTATGIIKCFLAGTGLGLARHRLGLIGYLRAYAGLLVVNRPWPDQVHARERRLDLVITRPA